MAHPVIWTYFFSNFVKTLYEKFPTSFKLTFLCDNAKFIFM